MNREDIIEKGVLRFLDPDEAHYRCPSKGDRVILRHLPKRPEIWSITHGWEMNLLYFLTETCVISGVIQDIDCTVRTSMDATVVAMVEWSVATMDSDGERHFMCEVPLYALEPYPSLGSVSNG